MFEVHLKGFKSLRAAKEFAEWFSGQGEQVIPYWWDALKDEGIEVGESPMATGTILTHQNVVEVTIRN